MNKPRRKFQVVSLTDAAAERVREIMAAASRPVYGLKVGVRNGGCAGMSYTMDMVDEPAKGDEIVEHDDVRILVDPKAVLFLLGTRMDFRTDKLSSGFVFENPNQTSACGCGESVAITPANPERLAAAS